MPITPNWYPRIPDAIAQLETLDRELLTRTDLEALLGVSRPRASQLLHRFHARPVGSQLVLDRLGLIRSLRAIRRGRPAKEAAARRTAVVTELRRARLAAVRVPVTPDVLQTQVAGLPPRLRSAPADRGRTSHRCPRRSSSSSRSPRRSPTTTTASSP